MPDGVKELLEPYIPSRKDSEEQDLGTRYKKMAAALRINLKPQSCPLKAVSKALAPFVENNGELVVVRNGESSYFERNGTPFTNFGIILLGTIHVHYADHSQHDLELLIWGQHLPPEIVRLDAKRLRSSGWIDDLGPKYIYAQWGIRNLKILIQAMAQYAPVSDEYMYSGWTTDGGDTYIMSGRQLCGNNWDMDKAKTSCLQAMEILDVAPRSLTIPLLAIALLSLVQSRMMNLGYYFKGVCCIVAPTQSFKTTLASLFFDFEHGREADINFEATAAAIVRTVGNARDSVTIVDDLKPGATKAETNEMVRKLSTIIRMASDDSGGIQKADRQNSTVSNIARGLVVVTAEHIPLSVQSTLARLLILEMSRKSVVVEKLTYFQNHNTIYQSFIEDYIQYIADQGTGQYCKRLIQNFEQERNTLRNELLSRDVPVDNRTSDMCTWLWIAFREFLNYAQEVGAISPERFDNYAEEAHTVFLSLMEQQSERVAELAPIKQFFRGLQVLLDTKEAKLGELQARNSKYAAADSKAAIGFTKNGYVYLKNGIALQAVTAYYHRAGKNFALNESALRKALADSGYLILGDKKSSICRLSVNHETYQCIKFPEAQFYQLLQGGKKNGPKFEQELPGDRALRKNADALLGPGG